MFSVPNLSLTDRDGDELAVFTWEKSGAGKFSWIDGCVDAEFAPLGGASLPLIKFCEGETRFLDARYHSRERYRPLEDHPDLFRTFAALSGTEDSFAGFANEYGDLGVGILQPEGEHSEPLRVWTALWDEMKVMGMALDAMHEAKHLDVIEKSFTLINDGIRVKFLPEDTGASQEFKGHLGGKRIIYPEIWAYATAARSKREFLRRCCAFWIQRRMNMWMDGWFMPEVQATGRMVLDPGVGRWHLRLASRTLAGAMCIQVARALEGHVRQRECDVCGRWFVISDSRKLGRRSDAIYCGDAKCRKTAWRRKQATARKKRKKGR